ncbi:MAG: TfoX/Sxy family protein [Planctomycetales bacterium]|nr:TfoX/Sxy family protein [Planctomycetales bacterium]
MTEQDRILVERIRPLMKRRKGYSEKKMFGGTCFMINGNMCVGPWKGSLTVRLSKDKHDETLSEPHVKPMDITGKVMKGWARVEPAGIKSEADLKSWIDRAVKFVRALPSK